MPNVFDFNPTSINPFPYWKWNKVLPAVYDDSLSQYEILCKLLDTVNNIITSTNSTGEQVEQLTQLVQQLIDGKFPSGIVQYVTDIANAAIDDDIATINTRIAALEAQINSYSQSMQGQIDTIDTSINSINDSINTINSNISAINSSLSNFSLTKNHIIVLGDSLSTYSYNNGVVTSGNELWSKVTNMTGVVIHNFAVGGAGFINTTYTTQTIGVQAQQAIDDTSIDVDTVRCIIVFAGTNDYTTATLANMQQAVRTIWSALGASRFAQVPIFFIFNQAGYGSHYDMINGMIYALSESYQHAPVKGFNGNSWLRWYNNIGSDNVHPNNYGYNTLAERMAQIITTGSVSIHDRPSIQSNNPYSATLYDYKAVYNGDELYVKWFYTTPAGSYAANNAGAELLRIAHMANVLTNEYADALYKPVGFSSNVIASLAGSNQQFMATVVPDNTTGDAVFCVSHPAFSTTSYAIRMMADFIIKC